jgi:hypothetical protein
MTKLEALRWTYILWRDIADSYHDKKEWVLDKWDVCDSYGLKFKHNCPCCQWMVENYGATLGILWCKSDLCPMAPIWGETEVSFVACEHATNSPYLEYCRCVEREAEAAAKIADGAWRLYLDECEKLNVPAGNKYLMPYDSLKQSRFRKKLDTYV